MNSPKTPIPMKPPMAPRKTTAIGTAEPRPSRMGFKMLSISPTMMHQTRKMTAFVVLAIANT